MELTCVSNGLPLRRISDKLHMLVIGRERERKIYMQNDIPTYLYHVQYLTL